MVDFLARLAERTLRTVPVAQPVLASRFAPGQVIPAPILETEAWSTAGAAPMQDPASAFRAEAGSVTANPGKPDNHASLHLEQDAMVEANSVAGDRVGTNQPEMNRPGTRPMAGSPGLSGRQPGFPAFTEEVGEPGSIEARFIAPSISLPQPVVTNQLPTATGQLPEEADTSETTAKELIPTPQARVPRLAPASSMTSQQGEPVALEQEETVSPQPVADHNNIVPLAPVEQIGMSLKRDTSFNPLVEETFDSIVASYSQTVSPINTTASHIHPGKEVTNQERFNTGSARNHADRNEAPLLHAARETYMVGAPLASALLGPADVFPGLADTLLGPAPTLHEASTHAMYMVGASLASALPGLHDQGQGDQKGNKASLSLSQPPSPLRTIGQVDVLPVEQHLLVSQAQLPQGLAPQEQADEPLINVFPSGSVRNLSHAPLAQHNPADLHSGLATASAAEAPPTPPSIHITIGRIDVRAVRSPGPTPPSKPARPSPLLSLDDYLKQGKGGRP